MLTALRNSPMLIFLPQSNQFINIPRAIPIPIIEDITGLAIEGCSKTVGIDIINEKNEDSTDKKTQQKTNANNSTVSFRLEGSLNSIGAKIILPMVDLIFYALSKDSFHKIYLSFYYRSIFLDKSFISAFSYDQDDDRETISINITLTRDIENKSLINQAKKAVTVEIVKPIP